MNNLRKILKNKGMTTYELAKRAEVGQATAHELVHGTREPRVSTAIKIANVLKCSIEDIFKEGE